MRRNFSWIYPLKWPLLALLSVLCVGAVSITWSMGLVADAQTEQQQVLRQLSTAHHLFATAKADQKNMKVYTKEYGELLKRHIIGDDHRMDWIDSLETIRKRNLILHFKYAIAPQHRFSATFPGGNAELHMSEMRMQFELLHEQQLMDFFAALRTDYGGWFSLDHCTIEAKQPKAAATSSLQAVCSGAWLTLNHKITK